MSSVIRLIAYHRGVIFRRTSEPTPAEPEPASAPKQPRDRTKAAGVRTPKRSEAQSKNYRPVVDTDRKAAKARARQHRNEAYERQRQAMITGDERYLPLRDQGKSRRYARDFVDARWNIGELFMPGAALMLITMFLANVWPQAAVVATIGMYVIVFAGIFDALIMVFSLKRRLAKRYQTSDIRPRTGFYAFSRAFMIRPWRMPKPQVKRGQFPH
ncbi:MAG: DUF3043 domain-containing protein [Bowdeniella nasicola]|nr:DUF3043 domain-containing protein [Bowdeniella nasicola]